jgi:hypothetical protein
MAETSLSLLERLRLQPDAASWQRLVDLYTPLIRGWLRRHAVTEADADADDLTQDVMAVVVQELPHFQHNHRLGGLAIGVLALGGGAIGALAFGGGAIGIVAIGGGAIGDYACGADALGCHVLSMKERSPEAVEFFWDWFFWEKTVRKILGG